MAELYKADPNYKWDDTSNTDFPIATITLTSGLDHYTLLDSALVIHRVRVKDTSGNYKTLTPVERRDVSDSELAASGTPDKYYKMGGAIFPIPVPNYGASNGMELEFQRGANHFTIADTTKEPGFNSQFHQFLSVAASLRYAVANGLKEKSAFLGNLLNNPETGIRRKMIEHYQLRSPDLRPQFSLKKRSVAHYGL